MSRRLAMAGVLQLALLGCADPQAAPPAVTSSPARRVDPPQPTTRPAASSHQPDSTPRTVPGPASQPGSAPRSQPATAANKPEFVIILARFDDAEPARVTGGVSGVRVVLNTDNVRIIRIDRRKLPFARGRSVPLLLDRQGIEMTGKSDMIDLVRSRNGEWTTLDK